MFLLVLKLAGTKTGSFARLAPERLIGNLSLPGKLQFDQTSEMANSLQLDMSASEKCSSRLHEF
jgi:hypothetical protein